jgi:hypothetical protein
MPEPAAHRPDKLASLPAIVPEPRSAERCAGTFVLKDDLPVVLPPPVDDATRICALHLKSEIARRLGKTLCVEAHARCDDLGPHLELRVDEAVSSESDPRLRAQAYRLEVQPGRVVATGAGAAGLRYAVETLLQLVGATGRVPACRIDDAPRLELRGIMLDVSRGKVPTPESVERLLELCVSLKLNVLMLYTEHTYRFRRHPLIGRDDSALDAETMLRLDAHAAERFIDLVPCLQSLGHMEHILAHERYRPLAETEVGWTITPVDDATYALLRDMYDEYLPNFRSRLFNANCDEPWDLGRGRSKERSAELGPGGLYLEHVRRIRDLALAHGKQTMIWGDVVHAHPERIPEIDRDLIMLDWWYESDFDYDRVGRFAESGHDFLVCPGTSSWNSLFPRVDNSLRNISGWADAGRRHGARGLINTDWGDHGHYNLQGNSYLAYAWGAQESWSGPSRAAEFDRAFSRLVFDDPRGEVARLYRALGAVHDPGFAMFNGSSLQYLFFDDVETAYFISAAKAGKLRGALKRLERLRPRIEAALAGARREALAIEEMLYAADASRLALEKARAGLDYNAWRRGPEPWKAVDRKRLAGRFRRLAEDQTALGRTLRRLWLARSRPSNLDRTLRRLNRSVRAMRAAASRLERNRPSSAPEPEPITGKGALEAVRHSLRD